MSNIRFLWNNLYDTATVSSYSEATNFPLSNIKQRWHTRHWRSVGLSNEWVKADLGSAQAITAFIVKYHNFTGSATVKIQANTIDDWSGTPPVDETLSITSDKLVKFWSAAQSYRWWRLLMTDASNPNGYLRIGRIFLGGFFSPTYQSTEYTESYADPSEIRYSTGGQISASEKTKYKLFSLSWNYLPSTDKSTLDTIFATVGMARPFFMTFNSSDTYNTTFYVQNRSEWQYVILKSTSAYSIAMTMEEAR